MGPLLEFVAAILAPLSIGLVFTAILAGVILGVLYNYPLNLDSSLVFHKAVAGWVFIMFIFIYRIVSTLAIGEEPPMIFGWIGIGLLWTTFCGAIYITDKTVEYINRRLRRRIFR